MHEKPILTFFKVYDKSRAKPEALLEFFDTDEACIPTYIEDLLDKGLTPVEAVAKTLLDLSPPLVPMTVSQTEKLLSRCDLDTPEKSALCILETHPLPDGNKRSAFLMFLAKYMTIYNELPCCKMFRAVLEKWFKHIPSSF